MSRRQRLAVTILCLLIAAIVVWFDQSRPIRPKQSDSSSQQPLSDFDRYNDKIFRVVKAVDGDTLYIDIPDGNDDYTKTRLWGVDTPETKHPKIDVMYFGPEAYEFTKKATLGKEVRVFLDTEQSRDKYDRILAYIQLPDGQFLNEVLLPEGLAYADVRFKHSYYHKYSSLSPPPEAPKRDFGKMAPASSCRDDSKEKNQT